MSTAIQTRNPGMVSMDQWSIMREQAAILVKTSFLPEAIKTPEQAIAIMLKGHELGVPTMHALNNIAVIKGKPTCNSELMLALIYRDHGDDAIRFETSTADQCTISYARRSWQTRKQHTFTMAEAVKAGLTTGANSATWQKYPAQMLRARCISAVARMAFPDSIGGMYTPEELGAVVQVNGETGEIIVDAQEVMPTDAGRAEQPQDARPRPQATPNAPTPIRAASVPAGAVPGSASVPPSVVVAGKAFRRAAEQAGFETREAQDKYAREQYPGRRLDSLTADEWHALEQKCRAMYSDVPAPEEALF